MFFFLIQTVSLVSLPSILAHILNLLIVLHSASPYNHTISDFISIHEEMDTPTTPIHVAPDVEVNLPDKPFESTDLELNPELEDEDDVSQDTNGVSSQNHHAGYSSDELIDVDTMMQIDLWTLPFESAYEVRKKQFSNHSDQPAVSEWQQSKFINYIDGELLQVQRNFIKNQADSEEVYPLGQLLEDVSKILDLIWYLINSNNRLYGQDEYLIKITGDLEDWIAYYSLDVIDGTNVAIEADLFKFFNFFQSLDTKLSFLIDGFKVGETQIKMSSTEIIRLMPIITRLRLEIVSKLDPSRARLTHLKALGKAGANALLNKLDVEIGRLFEGVLERS